MSSKSRLPASSARDELLLPNAVQTHQLDAIRDPKMPTRTLAAGIQLRNRVSLSTKSKRINDALRPAATEPLPRSGRQAEQA